MRAAVLGNQMPHVAAGAGWVRKNYLTFAPGPNGGTSSSVDMTGANFFAWFIAYNSASPVVASDLSDSLGNTWLAGPSAPFLNDVQLQCFYAKAASAGASQTFTVSHLTSFPGSLVLGYSGGAATPYVGTQDFSTGMFNGTIQCPSGVTPGQNGALILSGLSLYVSNVPTGIDAGFSVVDYIPLGAANNYGVAVAELIQSTAALVNPTWTATPTNSDPYALSLVEFNHA